MFPKDFDAFKVGEEIVALNRHSMIREEFLEKIRGFEPLRITSRCRLLRRSTDAFTHEYVILEFHETSDGKGLCFAEETRMGLFDPPEIERLIRRYGLSKWIFFAYGTLGFVFLWRRGGDFSIARWVGIPKNLFVTDINQLPTPAPPSLELSEPLRKFLGKRRHFVDLHAMAYEWPFFFHQFELYRLAQATHCRYLLPVAVGESLRALLLIPDGSGPDTIANPAVSPNIANFGIAAALSRPSR